MTNSEAEPRNTSIGNEDVITPSDVGKFVSNKGTEFEVRVRPNGLYFVHMKAGGKTPPLCDEHFTTRSAAELALTRYLQKGDRLGYAQYPDKERNAKSKTKQAVQDVRERADNRS